MGNVQSEKKTKKQNHSNCEWFDGKSRTRETEKERESVQLHWKLPTILQWIKSFRCNSSDGRLKNVQQKSNDEKNGLANESYNHFNVIFNIENDGIFFFSPKT